MRPKPLTTPARQTELFGQKIDREQLRSQLIGRLDAEGEFKLANKLRGCGLAFRLICRSCHAQHDAATRCSRKWCPSCASTIAAIRSARLALAIAEFEWPLFVTLTMQNVVDPDPDFDFVRFVREAFTKLRHRKIWTERVAGGAAAIEVTNTGKGWHPHIHAVIDCEWLAVKTPAPRPRESARSVRAKCQAAATEITAQWGKCLHQPIPPSVQISRCTPAIAKEIMKYALKPQHLIDSPDPIGPIIRMIDNTRMITTFGSCFRRGSEDAAKLGPKFTCPNGHADWTPYERYSREQIEEFQRGAPRRRSLDATARRKALAERNTPEARERAKYDALMTQIDPTIVRGE